jgi:hypothetical protein
MNIKKIIGTSMIALLVVALSVSMAAAYTIDGELDDWGLDLYNDDWSLESTWIPSGSSELQFQIEDNVDPYWNDSTHDTRLWHDGVPAYATGIHIIGTPSVYSTFIEPRVLSGAWAEPVGGEGYDIEAIYLDEDANNVYFAIVGSYYRGLSGDLALNINSTNSPDGYVYEYGIILHSGSDQPPGAALGEVYLVSEWNSCNTVPENSPASVKSGTKLGAATVVYNTNPTTAKDDHGTATIVIEGSIPKNLIGDPSNVDMFSNVYYTLMCGNDSIPIPEFTVLAVPLMALVGLVFFMRRKKD